MKRVDLSPSTIEITINSDEIKSRGKIERWFGIDKIENGKEKMRKLKDIFDEYLNGVRVRANYLL